MKQINPNIYPKDGYRFKDQDGSVHTADSWAGVIARVKRYRTRQGKPADTVDREVIEQACQRNPILCVEDNGVTQGKLAEATLKTRVLRWLQRIRASKGELRFVDNSLHDARADVCHRCPLDKSLPEGCSSCREALKEMREDIVGKRTTDSRITACPVLGEYLHVSTWIDVPTVANDKLPWECWRKKTL